MKLAGSVPITNNNQLSISILGDRGSGKTSCALCLGQCPFLELGASRRSSVLQTVIQTQQQTQSQIVLIHDSYEFLLTNTVLLLIDASRPESALYLKQFLKQIHSSQLVFVLINKCDVASREQFRQAVQFGLEFTQQLQQTNNCQLCTTIMRDNFSLQQLTEILALSLCNQRYQNARAEMLRAQKEFSRFFQQNAQNFRDRINGSLEKRGFERLVQAVFPAEAPAAAQPPGDGERAAEAEVAERAAEEIQAIQAEAEKVGGGVEGTQRAAAGSGQEERGAEDTQENQSGPEKVHGEVEDIQRISAGPEETHAGVEDIQAISAEEREEPEEPEEPEETAQ